MITVSICTYHTPFSDLDSCLASLTDRAVKKVTIVDNARDQKMEEYARAHGVDYLPSPNLGYGHAHNLAMLHTDAPYHLVLNADVYFSPEVIPQMIGVMERNPGVVQLQPKVLNSDGSLQYDSRQIPSFLVLMGRRFFPKLIKGIDERFMLMHMDQNRPISVMYQTGCFMLERTSTVKSIGGFDERFFLYPEDIDLSRRMAEKGVVLYWPGVTIVHNHAAASYTSTKMLWIHMSNLLKYFAKWLVVGRWMQRTKMNKRINYIEIQ